MEVRVAVVLVEEMPVLEGQHLELADSSYCGAAVAPEGIGGEDPDDLDTRHSSAMGCD